MDDKINIDDLFDEEIDIEDDVLDQDALIDELFSSEDFDDKINDFNYNSYEDTPIKYEKKGIDVSEEDILNEKSKLLEQIKNSKKEEDSNKEENPDKVKVNNSKKKNKEEKANNSRSFTDNVIEFTNNLFEKLGLKHSLTNIVTLALSFLIVVALFLKPNHKKAFIENNKGNLNAPKVKIEDVDKNIKANVSIGSPAEALSISKKFYEAILDNIVVVEKILNDYNNGLENKDNTMNRLENQRKNNESTLVYLYQDISSLGLSNFKISAKKAIKESDNVINLASKLVKQNKLLNISNFIYEEKEKAVLTIKNISSSLEGDFNILGIDYK